MIEDRREPLVPSPGQLAWQHGHQPGLYCHFGINAFHCREWSNGTLPAASFMPTGLDCRQWARAASETGAGHLILTAIHHDGPRLWPTSSTDYPVRSSPYRDGTGDVVAELAAAWRYFDLGPGPCPSAQDRHGASWHDDPATYDRFSIRQRTELCIIHRPMFELRFDGAESGQHPYHLPAIMATGERDLADAPIFYLGPRTIRWVDNEDGLTRAPCWHTVNSTQRLVDNDGHDALPEGVRSMSTECDVAIRRHWLWDDNNPATPKLRQHHEAIWYRSVRLGANLLPNGTPDRRGPLNDDDRELLLTLRRISRERFATPAEGVLSQHGIILTVNFGAAITSIHLVLMKAIEGGQRIRRHRVVDAKNPELIGGVHTVWKPVCACPVADHGAPPARGDRRSKRSGA